MKLTTTLRIRVCPQFKKQVARAARSARRKTADYTRLAIEEKLARDGQALAS